MDKVKIGIVGSRFQADCIASSVKAMPDEAEVVAVASPTPGNAEAFARRHGIPRFHTDYRDMLREQVLRYAAEMENTRRRAEREANDARAYAIQKFARDLLGVADNLARAMQAAPRESEDTLVKNFVVGIEMTEKELQSAFERNGLKRIHPEKGEKFDPHKHQAMMEAPGTDVAPGGVVDVMRAPT